MLLIFTTPVIVTSLLIILRQKGHLFQYPSACWRVHCTFHITSYFRLMTRCLERILFLSRRLTVHSILADREDQIPQKPRER